MRSARSRSRAELARHVDRIVMRPTGSGAARHYVASGEWDFVGSRQEMEQAPGLLGRGACMVAGAAAMHTRRRFSTPSRSGCSLLRRENAGLPRLVRADLLLPSCP